MALKPRNPVVTRQRVAGWLNIWNNADPATRPALKDFIQKRLDNLQMVSQDVDTTGHDDKDDTTPMVEMIMEDLPSYGFPPS